MNNINDKIFTIVDALQSLRPDGGWSLKGNTYEGLWWSEDNDLPAPTEEEIELEIQRLQKEYDDLEYQRLRKAEYPPIEDQLDMIYHQGIEGWKIEIDKVKNKYPKPEKL